MKLIDLIVGARPNFMKIAAVSRALDSEIASGLPLRYRVVHTGQHYDKAMSSQIFTDLDLPEPEINFGVGSGTQAEQTGNIMVAYERLLSKTPSNLCIVVGDVNSTLSCAITARKCGVPVAHVEAGIRSGDWSMPEEINRVATDSISNYFFTTTSDAKQRLVDQGFNSNSVFFVGNTMIDTLLRCQERFTPPEFCTGAPESWSDKKYIVLTMHRPSNVQDAEALSERLDAICLSAEKSNCHVIFPMHPRTRIAMAQTSFDRANLKIIDPLGYLEFNFLVNNSVGVVTDSGGITEETTVLGIPCITLRDNTERPETVELGTNELIGTDVKNIPFWVEKMCSGDWKKSEIPDLWDGGAGVRIVKHLKEILL